RLLLEPALERVLPAPGLRPAVVGGGGALPSGPGRRPARAHLAHGLPVHRRRHLQDRRRAELPVWCVGCVLVSGVIDLALGVLIWLEWHASAFWALGLFLGISLVFRGFNWIGLG